MIKTLFILVLAILILTSFSTLIKLFKIKNKGDLKNEVSNIGIAELNKLKDSIGINKKYQKLVDAILKEAENKMGIDLTNAKKPKKAGKHPTKHHTTVLTDDEDHPFQITKEVSELTDNITKDASTNEEKIKNLYDWFIENIKYGTKKRSNDIGYRTSNEVFKDKEGVCGEMAVLFIVMSRHIGIKSNYVSVRVDRYNEEVYHACANVHINRNTQLIDPAYNQFNASHKEIIVRTDVEAMTHLKQWRRNT